MKTRIAIGLLSMAAALAAPRPARAASQVLDDFTTGHYTKTARCTAGPIQAARSGTMIGGVRATTFEVSCANPFDQEATLDIRRGGPLVVDSGIRAFTAVGAFYGFQRDGITPAPLDLDLSAFDRLRVKFDSNDLGLNFNVVVFMRDGTSRVHAGCTIPPRPSGISFSVDLRFADDFVTELGTADWSDVDFIAVLWQPSSAIGANDYAVLSFDATDEADSAALLCHDVAASVGP